MKKPTDDLKDFVKKLVKTSISAKRLTNKLDELLIELLVPGAYYLRPNPKNPKRAIFGQILSPKTDLDYALLEDKKYRLVKAHSTECVSGARGMETVDNMLPISPDLFEYAKSKAWDITTKDALQFVLLLARAESGQTPQGSA